MPLDTQSKYIPFRSLIDVIGIADPASTDVDIEFLNQVMELKRQKEQMAEDVAEYGGLSELKGVDLTASKGLDDDFLMGIGMGSMGVKGKNPYLNKTGDLTNRGFTKVQNMLKSIIDKTSKQSGMPSDILKSHYGFNKSGEYFRSEPILEVGKGIKYNEFIDLIKKTASKLNPRGDKQKILNTVNEYSQNQLNALEVGNTKFKVPTEVTKLNDILETINSEYRNSIEKLFPK